MKKTHHGFTLIDMVLYMALLSCLLCGSVFTTYNLIESAHHLDSNAVVEEEGNFVLRKIDWVLSSAQAVSLPTAHELIVTRSDGTTITIALTKTSVSLEEGTGVFVPLTTDNVTVSSLSFARVGTNDSNIKATLILNGVTFETEDYLWQ
jgi:Na+-translocating ferredoxin:NAD+ oxidoreductase RnfA subunit